MPWDSEERDLEEHDFTLASVGAKRHGGMYFHTSCRHTADIGSPDKRTCYGCLLGNMVLDGRRFPQAAEVNQLELSFD